MAKNGYIELNESKKSLVLHLLKKKEDSSYNILKLLKISTTRMKVIKQDLNHLGIISFRTDKNGEERILLNPQNIAVKYDRDKYMKEFAYLIIILISGTFIAVAVHIYFLFGIIYSSLMFFLLFLFKTMSMSDSKKIFVKTAKGGIETVSEHYS